MTVRGGCCAFRGAEMRKRLVRMARVRRAAMFRGGRVKRVRGCVSIVNGRRVSSGLEGLVTLAEYAPSLRFCLKY